MLEAFYFGRFQPPLLKHGMIARESMQTIRGQGKLVVGVAQNIEGLNRNNILRGDESVNLFKETLSQLGVHEGQIGVEAVPIEPSRPLSESIITYWQQRGTSPDKQIVVFSGSPSTIAACHEAKRAFPKVQIAKLEDDDQTGPRARTIRQYLIDWDIEEILKSGDIAAQAVLEYLTRPLMQERVTQLPEGEKRPWAISSESPVLLPQS